MAEFCGSSRARKMKPKGRRASVSCDAFLDRAQVKTRGAAPNKNETFKSLSGEGVQCEMGNEVFRRFWTPPSYGEDENEIGQVITGDPIGTIPFGWNSEEHEAESKTTSNEENSIIEPTDKVDSKSSSSWTNALSSHQIIVDRGPDHSASTCNVPVVPDLSLTNNGSAVIFPMVLNVVDKSGTKEVVAVVSLDPMRPGDTSLADKEGTSSAKIEEIPDSSITKTYSCGDCQSEFSSIVLYEEHCASEHDNIKPFKCSKCTRRFKRRQDMVRHIICHPEAFCCKVCSMKFSRQEELVLHYKTHESSSPTLKHSEENTEKTDVFQVEKFECSQCDRTFSDADLLQHHEFTHSEGELYPCDQCGRTFREEKRLGMHLKLHKKNQRCEKCDEVFTNLFDFNEHMIAHKYDDSKEEFKCAHCKLSFSSFYYLKKHVMNHGMEVHWCGDCGGSGHVGPHSQHDAGENPVAQFVKHDNPTEEDDPLKLEDSSGDDLISGDIEEQLQIEVQVDDVVIKHENWSSSENEAGVSDIVHTKAKTIRQKRKRSGRTPAKICQERRRKSARND